MNNDLTMTNKKREIDFKIIENKIKPGSKKIITWNATI